MRVLLGRGFRANQSTTDQTRCGRNDILSRSNVEVVHEDGNEQAVHVAD